MTHFPSRDGSSDLNPTLRLLEAARKGDQRAFELLFRRYRLPLTRWAHRRLSHAARAKNDTGDLVLISFRKAFEKVGTFEYRRDGAFLGYLHQALHNTVAGANRDAMRKPPMVPIDGHLVDPAPGPAADFVTKEQRALYEAALATLPPHIQALIRMKEMGLSYVQMAVETGMTPNAARMAVTRAIEKLSRAIGDQS